VNSERRFDIALRNAHFRYRGSIEYRDTQDGIVIVAPISGIAQHYFPDPWLNLRGLLLRGRRVEGGKWEGEEGEGRGRVREIPPSRIGKVKRWQP